MSEIERIMLLGPVIPVLVIEDVAHAVPIARALVAGGLPVLEVTLRTDCALDVIREMKQVPGAIVGAGTVVTTEQVAQVKAAGAEFIVSPGLSQPLGAAIADAANQVPSNACSYTSTSRKPRTSRRASAAPRCAT